MAMPVTGMTRADLVAETKALMKKRQEINDRLNLLGQEIHRRNAEQAADRAAGIMTDEEIDQMESAIKRSRARREKERVKHTEASH